MRLVSFFLFFATTLAQAADVHVIGEMRRMFTDHDIGPNVDLSQINVTAHVYGLGPVAGLKGEITVLDGETFVSQAVAERPRVALAPSAKAVFLVYASVTKWRSVDIPAAVVSETDLAGFLERQFHKNTRSPFLVRGTAVACRYHIQNFMGKAEDLTHELHDRAKVFLEVTNAPVELVGFFTNLEKDGGTLCTWAKPRMST